MHHVGGKGSLACIHRDNGSATLAEVTRIPSMYQDQWILSNHSVIWRQTIWEATCGRFGVSFWCVQLCNDTPFLPIPK